jgi:hypothetical protein
MTFGSAPVVQSVFDRLFYSLKGNLKFKYLGEFKAIFETASEEMNTRYINSFGVEKSQE